MNELIDKVVESVKRTQKEHKGQSGPTKKVIALQTLRMSAQDDERLSYLINTYASDLIDLVVTLARDKKLHKILKKSCKICF